MPLNIAYKTILTGISLIPPIIPGISQIPMVINLCAKGIYLVWYIVYFPIEKVISAIDQTLCEIQQL